MPVSPWRNIGSVIEVVMATDPRSFLDIGVGNGKWGYLVREYVDIWQKRYTRESWQVVIEGVEVWEPYIHDYQRQIYDRIHIGRAQDVVPTLSRNFDLILACDVVEHLSKAEAVELIKNLHRITQRVLLLSIPVGPDWLRESYSDNPYEAHLSEWTPAEFKALGASWIQVSKIQDDRRDTALVAFLGTEWRQNPPPVPHGFSPFLATAGESLKPDPALAEFVRNLGSLLATPAMVQVEWVDSRVVEITFHEGSTGSMSVLRTDGKSATLPLNSGFARTVLNLGSLARVDDLSLQLWLAEVRRIGASNLWVALERTPGRDRAWWIAQFQAAGFAWHPRSEEIIAPPADPKHDTSVILLLQAVAAV